MVIRNKSQLWWDLPALDSFELNRTIYGVEDGDYRDTLRMTILAAAGLGWADVVKTTVLLADIADFKAVNEVYARHVTGPVLPARAAFAVAALPLGAGVEIEAVAVRP